MEGGRGVGLALLTCLSEGGVLGCDEPGSGVQVGRNLNIVRANNKALGSPVNRINIMARYACRM